MHEHQHLLAKGIVGTSAPLLGALTSMQEQLEHWLRIGSLCIGILVGILTAWSIWRGLNKR